MNRSDQTPSDANHSGAESQDLSSLSRGELEETVRRLRSEKNRAIRELERHRSENGNLEDYRYFFDHLKDALFLVGVNQSGEELSFTIDRISGRHEEYSGLKNHEVAGRSPHELFDREMADHVTSRYRECVEKRQTIIYEETLNFPVESSVWLTELTPIVEGNRVDKLVGRSRPLSEWKFENEQSRFKKVIDASGYAVLVTDPDGTIQYVNRAFERMTGFSADEAIGNTPNILNSGTHDEAFFRDLWETISGGDVWKGEIINETKSGDHYVAEQTIAPMQTSQDDVWGYVAIQQDITEQKEEQRSHRLKSRAMDSAPIGIVMTDHTREDNPIFYVNEGFQRLTGYDEEEILGRNCRFLQGSETREKPVEKLRRAVREERSEVVELRNYRKDGSLFWNRVTISPMTDEEGNVTRFLGFQQNVTEEKEKERRLQLFRETIDRSPDEIFIIDPDTARFMNVNRTVEKNLGYSRDELLDMRVHDIKPEPGEKFSWAPLRERILREGPITFQADHRRKDGTTFPVEIHADGLELDGTTRIIASARDISERVKARRDAEEWAGFLKDVNDQFPGVTYRFLRTPDGSYSFPYMSSGYEELAGVSSEAAKDSFEEACRYAHPEDLDEVLASIEEAAETMSPWIQEYRYRLPDGRVNWVLASSTPEQQPDGSIVWTGVMIDITDRKRAEQQLRKNERRFRTLYEEANEPMIIADLDDEILDLNPAATDHLGYEREALTGESIEEILPENRFGESENVVRSMLDEHGTRLFETEHLRRDGTRVPVEVSQTVIDYSGREAVMYFARDLSRLEWSRRRMRAIFDSTHTFIGLLDPEGRILEMNRAFKDAVGASDEDLSGESLSARSDWWGDRHARRIVEEHLSNARDGGFVRFKTRFQPVHGGERVIDFSLTPISDDRDQLIYLVLEGRDVTEREDAIREMRESREREERFRQLAETIGVIFWLYDPETERYLYLSSDCDRVYGVHCDELYEGPEQLFENVHPADRETVRSLYEEQLTDGFDATYRMQVHGDWIWLHDRAYPVTEDGSVRMVAGIAEDITEDVEKERKLKKQIQETERISKIKSDFVARTTHDLRTPLNAILGHVALLWETDLSPEQKRDLERIRMAGQSMVHLTNDILDLDRVESGKLELHEEPIRIRALIDDVMSLFRPKVSEQDLRLSCSVGEAVPEWVRVDPDRLKQILVNLAGNALKFTVEGHVDVSVAVERDRDEELVLAFEVSDTGPGIEPEKQEEIFRERKKGSDHAAISTTGAGIGLSITQNLVHAMDGEISVDSVPGEGSTFRFTVRCESVEEKPEDGKRRPEQASLDGTRVLVVDDSGPIRSMLTRFLDNAGIEAESVATGAEAVERLTGEGSEKTFDVVFLDQGLDDCSGFDVLEKVDGAEPGIDPERIYILSGEARAKIRSERPDVPVAGVLEKPVSQSQLVRSVQFVLTTFENEASETPDEREEIQLSAPRDLHVMLVDDDPEAREILARFLSDAVEKITTVSRGREAVRNRFEKMPDVVLMDLEMPEMNGLDATEAIREREWEQGHNSVPIIFQTARAMKQDEEKCFEAGGDAFLRKPVNRAELLSTLESVLEEGVSSR